MDGAWTLQSSMRSWYICWKTYSGRLMSLIRQSLSTAGRRQCIPEHCITTTKQTLHVRFIWQINSLDKCIRAMSCDTSQLAEMFYWRSGLFTTVPAKILMRQVNNPIKIQPMTLRLAIIAGVNMRKIEQRSDKPASKHFDEASDLINFLNDILPNIKTDSSQEWVLIMS